MYRVEAIGLSFEHSGLSMVCSLGALKLCELCPVKGTRLASYYAIGTYSVLGTQPILGCISPSGASPELAEIMSEIVNLAAHLGRSGYCPTPGTRIILMGCLQVDDGVVGGCFYRRELERACERVRAGSRSADVGLH